MATVRAYKVTGGARRYVAMIRLKGFSPISKSFDTKREARDWADQYERELRAERERGGARAEVGELTVARLIELFLADPQTRQRRYYEDLSLLLAEWVNKQGARKVREFGREHIARFRNERAAINAPATVNRYLSAMRRCWNWGIEQGYVLSGSRWPTKLMLAEPKAREAIASADELQAIFTTCDGVEAALGSLVRFLVGTGARLSDALAVTWRDVDEKAADVAIRGQKTDRPQRVAMLAPALDGLATAGKVKHLSGRVFWQFETDSDVRYPWKKARRQFPEHLRGLRLHDCRHLCASLLASAGATDVELAAQLGHSTLAMVKRYSHLRGGHRGEGHKRVDALFFGAIRDSK